MEFAFHCALIRNLVKLKGTAKLQGVSTLSGQSNLLISPTQNWFIFDSLGSNSPQDKNNLYGGIGFYKNSIYYL